MFVTTGIGGDAALIPRLCVAARLLNFCPAGYPALAAIIPVCAVFRGRSRGLDDDDLCQNLATASAQE
jgi:hypothetical protein